MSLISQTVNYTTPGVYTYTVPSGVSSLEFHIWGAGGASGSSGPFRSVVASTVTSQVQTGVVSVPSGTVLLPDGTKRVQVGTRQVQTGTQQVQTGTQQVQSGTTQVKVGTKQEAYQVVQQNSKGGKNSYNNGKGSGTSYVTKYRTVDVFETRPVFTTVAVFGSQPVYTSVPIYEDQTVFREESTFDLVPVYGVLESPVYENRSGGLGGTGAGGGYSNRKIKVTAGDIIKVYVGGPGNSYLGGYSYTDYTGGSAGSASATGRGGGGGGATVVTLNGTVIAVAAGGGGGGGGGPLGAAGGNGSPARISGSRRDDSKGQDSAAGPSTGGGGGGGMRDGGGLAGSSGSIGSGGDGGISLGTIIQAGNGTAPGGLTVRSYPGRNAGRAGNSGAAILTFTKSFNINIKQSNQWKSIDRAWVKIDGEWKEILNGWTKVSGAWKPLITSRSIEGAEDPVTPTTIVIAGVTVPAITYSLSSNAASVNEGVAVGFTLSTTGLTAGAVVPYIASGLNTADLAAGSLTGSFIVGTTDTITFVTKLDNNSTGARNLKVYINNTDVVANCTISDTSLSPVYTVTGNVASINENQAVRFVLGNVNGIAGETIRYEISGISASRLAVGSDPLTGTFVVGSDEITNIGISNNLNTDGASTMTMTLVGRGARATCTIADTSQTVVPSGNQTFVRGGTFVVPMGVTSLNIVATGGGGGGGGADGSANSGYPGGGYPGAKVTATLSVVGGQTYTIDVGYGGAYGAGRASSAAGGAGGSGAYPGGRGGNAGSRGSSGAGGGGGGASAVLLNGQIIVVAGGGAGAGGSGNGNYGLATIGTFNSSTSGAQGQDKSGDGGGGGGGGGGFPFGGAGGTTPGGDAGAYSGTTGQSVLAGGSLSTGTNGGAANSGNGGNGSVFLSW